MDIRHGCKRREELHEILNTRYYKIHTRSGAARGFGGLEKAENAKNHKRNVPVKIQFYKRNLTFRLFTSYASTDAFNCCIRLASTLSLAVDIASCLVIEGCFQLLSQFLRLCPLGMQDIHSLRLVIPQCIHLRFDILQCSNSFNSNLEYFCNKQRISYYSNLTQMSLFLWTIIRSADNNFSVFFSITLHYRFENKSIITILKRLRYSVHT